MFLLGESLTELLLFASDVLAGCLSCCCLPVMFLLGESLTELLLFASDVLAG